MISSYFRILLVEMQKKTAFSTVQKIQLELVCMQLELAHMRNLVCLEKGKKNSKGQTIKKISFDLRHKRRKKSTKPM